jgi:hypothetical protein
MEWDERGKKGDEKEVGRRGGDGGGVGSFFEFSLGFRYGYLVMMVDFVDSVDFVESYGAWLDEL